MAFWQENYPFIKVVLLLQLFSTLLVEIKLAKKGEISGDVMQCGNLLGCLQHTSVQDG